MNDHADSAAHLIDLSGGQAEVVGQDVPAQHTDAGATALIGNVPER